MDIRFSGLKCDHLAWGLSRQLKQAANSPEGKAALAYLEDQGFDVKLTQYKGDPDQLHASFSPIPGKNHPMVTKVEWPVVLNLGSGRKTPLQIIQDAAATLKDVLTREKVLAVMFAPPSEESAD